jgi:hypothetical protein
MAGCRSYKNHGNCWCSWYFGTSGGSCCSSIFVN